MAGNYDELTAVLIELLTNRFAPKPQFTRGLLGDGLGNVTVPGRPDKNYVRFNRGSTEYFEVFNVTVNAVNDWPVLIGELPWLPGLTQVVGTDWAAYEQSGWDDNTGATSPHAPTHEWPDQSPGSDVVNIYMRSIVPLRAYSLGTGSTTIYVNSYEYENPNGSGTIWGGLPGVDLSPVMTALSTGTARLMGIYLNPNTNTLGVVTGATDIFTDASLPPYPQFPRGVIPSARIRVYGGQASIGEADIIDARQPFSFIPTGTASSGGGYPFNTITVDATDTDADHATLAAAVAAASSGATIEVGPGTYTCDDIAITQTLRIIATNLNSTIFSTSTGGTMFDVNNGAVLTLEAVTLSASVTSTNLSGIKITGNGTVRLRYSSISITASGANAYGVEINNGTLRAVDTEIAANSAATGRAIYAYTDATNVIELTGGTLNGTSSGTDLYITAGSATLKRTQFNNNTMQATDGTVVGSAINDNGQDAGFIVVNSSGATVADGDIGYIDETGDFQTTTTAQDPLMVGNGCVVTIGGDNGNLIFVAKKGHYIINYTGSAPAAGDFLVSSTSAGDAQAQTTMHYNIFAVCTAAGSAGQVEAQLLINRIPIPLPTTKELFRINSHSGTNFVGSIVIFPAAGQLEYNVTTGNEDSIVPGSATDLAKIVLHNTTRGNTALIDTVNTTNTATPAAGTITLTTTVPVGWSASDVITTRSQTNTGTFGASYFMDIDLSDTDNDVVPALATTIMVETIILDTGSTMDLAYHPLQAYNTSKLMVIRQQASNTVLYQNRTIPLINKKFTLSATATGSATSTLVVKLIGAWVASP